MKFILRGQNFDSQVNFSPNPTNLILVDNNSGGLEAILSSDYNISGYRNLGGTYNPLGTIHAQLLDIYLCSDPSHIVYGEGGNTFKLASEVNPDSLEPLKTAYSEGEESSVCYITDYIKITPGTNMVQASPAEFQDYLYCVNNTFDFKALADKGWNITYYDQNLCEPSPLNGQANVDTKVTVAPKSQTQPCNYTMDLDSTEGICTPGPEFCWTDWATNINYVNTSSYTVRVAEKRATISLSITGTKPTGSFRYEFRNVPSWATIDSSSLDFLGTEVMSGNFKVICEDTTQVRSADFQLIILGPDQKPYSITNYTINQAITPKITLDPSSLTVSNTGSVETVNIDYSGTFTLTSLVSDGSWLSAKIADKVLTVTVKENKYAGRRTGTVTVEAGVGNTAELTITQAGIKPELVVEPTEVNLTYSAQSNSTVSVSLVGSSDTITARKLTEVNWLESVAIAAGKLYFRVSENTGSSTRSATVRIEAGSLQKDVTINQDAKDPQTVVITDPSEDVTVTTSEVNFVARSLYDEGSWEATSDSSWMTKGNTVAEGHNLSGKLIFDNNTTGAPRTATLTVRRGTASATRRFTQGESSTSVEITCVTALNLESTANVNKQLTIAVTGTAGTEDYSVNYVADQSWINIDSSAVTNSSSGNTVDYRGYLKISTPANPATSPRTGNITIQFIEGGKVKASETVLVTQAGSSSTILTLSPETLNLDSKDHTGKLTINYTGTGTLRVSGASWMTVSVSGTSVDYSITQNTSESSRTGYITVTDNTLEATCKVVQTGTKRPTVNVTRTLPTPKATWNVTKEANTGTLAWKASGSSYGLATEISSSTDVSWITLTGENVKTTTADPYSLEQTRSISVEANSGEARVGHISMFVSFSSGFAYEEQLTVEQPKGGNEYLVITPDSVSTGKDASTQKINFSYSETGSLTTTTVGDSWVTGPTRVSGSGDYNFNVSANVTGRSRTTTFKYTSPSGLSKNLTFTQAGDTASIAQVNWIQPDSSPKTLPEGTYSDKFLWTATGNYVGSVVPRFEYEYLINGYPSSAVVVYPGEVNEQVYTEGNISIRQKGDFSVNRNALKEGVNTVQVNPKLFQGDKLIAQRTQTWLVTKPKSSPSGSGSGSYDPGNPGDTDIPENYITVVNQATPFYIAEENNNFTFTAQYAGPYSGNYSISATGVTEISRVDNSGNGVVNVQVTYRVTSSSQVTLRLSDSTTTLGYLTIPVYKVAATVYSVSDDVILSGNSGDLMTITQNSSNRLIWNDPVYAAPGYTTVNVNATQMLRELVEAPRLNLNASSPRSIDTFSVRIGSSLSNLALVDSWNGFTTGFASTYLNSEIAFNSYIPATVINGGSIEIRTPLGNTVSYSGNSKQYLDVTYKVSLCGIYRVNGKSLKVVDSDYQLFFYNTSGGWSSLVPRAVANPGYQFSRSSYQLSPTQTRVYQVDTVKTWKLRTAWISEDLSDLFGSARVYLHDIKAGKLYEVTITDTKYDFKTFRNNQRKLVSVEINVQSVNTSIRR